MLTPAPRGSTSAEARTQTRVLAQGATPEATDEALTARRHDAEQSPHDPSARFEYGRVLLRLGFRAAAWNESGRNGSSAKLAARASHGTIRDSVRALANRSEGASATSRPC